MFNFPSRIGTASILKQSLYSESRGARPSEVERRSARLRLAGVCSGIGKAAGISPIYRVPSWLALEEVKLPVCAKKTLVALLIP